MYCLASFTPIGARVRSHETPYPLPPLPPKHCGRRGGWCWECEDCLFAPVLGAMGTERIGVGITGVPARVGKAQRAPPCPGPPTKHQG